MMKFAILPALILAAVLTPSLAQAYIGPGAGISAIGAALALLAAIFFAIVGFVWYPVKRLLKAMRSKSGNAPTQIPPAGE